MNKIFCMCMYILWNKKQNHKHLLFKYMFAFIYKNSLDKLQFMLTFFFFYN